MSGTAIQVKKTGEKKKRVVVKRSDPVEPSPDIPAQDRETRIDFTLDMVLNDLIQQGTEGHLNPAKSYLFKTQEMKEHIGRMCDRVHRRKNGFPDKDPVIPEQNPPTSDDQLPENPEVNQEPPTLTLKKKVSKVKKQDSETAVVKGTKKPARKRSNSKTRKEKGSNNNKSLPATPKVSKMGKKKAAAAAAMAEIAGVDSSVLGVEAIDHLLMRTPISFPGAAFQRMNERFDPEIFPRTAEVQTYRATVDLRGFADNHISLELDGRRLIIVAQRPHSEEFKLHARKVIEIIDIPDGVILTALKIGRGSDGSLLVEETLNI